MDNEAKKLSEGSRNRGQEGKKVAFTLAEVLITLGIIGVVAAVTMPVLINNYQKKVTVNKIKKFYTNMNQVLLMAKNDYGDINSWNNSEDFYNNYIKPYIKNVEKVQKEIHVHGDFERGIRFVFADGTQAILSASKGQNYVTNSRIEIIYYTRANNYIDIDSNDIKNPKRERFYFIVDDNANLLPPKLSASREQNLKDCNKQRVIGSEKFGNNGYATCSTIIYKDGWKIAPDYPW